MCIEHCVSKWNEEAGNSVSGVREAAMTAMEKGQFEKYQETELAIHQVDV